MEPTGLVPSPQLLSNIMAGLRIRYAELNDIKYEAAWSDGRCYCRCFHAHKTIIDAAKCGMPQPGFYVLAVERGKERELTADEDWVVNGFRFGRLADSATCRDIFAIRCPVLEAV